MHKKNILLLFLALNIPAIKPTKLRNKRHRAAIAQHMQEPNKELDQQFFSIIADTKIINNFFFKAINDNNIEEVAWLIKTGADVNAVDRIGQSVLCVAADNNYLAIVELLLKHGANSDQRKTRRRTPLMQAVLNGHLEMVNYLLTNEYSKSNINKCYGDETALSLAARTGNLPMVQYLVQHGAHVNAVYTSNFLYRYYFPIEIPLHQAVKSGKIEVITYLLTNEYEKASINAVTRFRCRDLKISHFSWTALHEAAHLGNLQAILCLLKHGAKQDIPGDEGLTPEKVVSLYGYHEINDYFNGLQKKQ